MKGYKFKKGDTVRYTGPEVDSNDVEQDGLYVVRRVQPDGDWLDLEGVFYDDIEYNFGFSNFELVPETKIVPQHRIINKKWRLIEIRTDLSAQGFKEWCLTIYGTDIFVNNVPFLKMILLGNILYWILN